MFGEGAFPSGVAIESRGSESRRPEAFQGDAHSLAGEPSFVAEERKHSGLVRRAPDDGRIRLDGRMEEEFPYLLEILGEATPNFLRCTVETPDLADQLHALLRSDAFDPFVEVRPHEDRNVDELFPCDGQGAEPRIELDDLRPRRSRSSETGKELRPGDRKEPRDSRRAEQEGIVVFRAHGPREALAGQPRCLGLPLTRRLAIGDAERLAER